MSYADVQDTTTAAATSGNQLSLTVTPTFGPPPATASESITKQVIIGVIVSVIAAVAIAHMRKRG